MGWVVNATPRRLYPGKRESVAILWKAGWAAGPVCKDSTNLNRSPECPVRSESLYWLSYPGPHNLLYRHVVVQIKDCVPMIRTGWLRRFIFHDSRPLSGPGPHHCRCFTISLRHTAFCRTSLDERSARRKEIKQGRKCKYNVIFRSFRATVFAVENH